MPFVEPREIGPKPWGQELLLAEGPGYQLKRLVYEAGHQGGFQLHQERDEAFTLHEGQAIVSWIEDGKVQQAMAWATGEKVFTFHVPPGTPHKFHALTRCVVYEASNGLAPASVNVADEYGDEDGQAR